MNLKVPVTEHAGEAAQNAERIESELISVAPAEETKQISWLSNGSEIPLSAFPLASSSQHTATWEWQYQGDQSPESDRSSLAVLGMAAQQWPPLQLDYRKNHTMSTREWQR